MHIAGAAHRRHLQGRTHLTVRSHDVLRLCSAPGVCWRTHFFLLRIFTEQYRTLCTRIIRLVCCALHSHTPMYGNFHLWKSFPYGDRSMQPCIHVCEGSTGSAIRALSRPMAPDWLPLWNPRLAFALAVECRPGKTQPVRASRPLLTCHSTTPCSSTWLQAMQNRKQCSQRVSDPTVQTLQRPVQSCCRGIPVTTPPPLLPPSSRGPLVPEEHQQHHSLQTP